MSHDTEAAYASSEVADLIMKNQVEYFGNIGTAGTWSVFAGREGGRQWPLADGVISAQNSTASEINIAFEYKRPNEGVHGILTALGQSFAYLEKGYRASVMVIPEKFVSHADPGGHVKRVIDSTVPDIPISIYTYSQPNLSATRPFLGKLKCIRDISLPSCRVVTKTGIGTSTSGSVTTLWAHMREGMSHPDAFYRYCQSVKVVTVGEEDLSNIVIPVDLKAAIHRIDPTVDEFKYLSNTSGDEVSDKAWRHVWFNYYFWNELMPIFKGKLPYNVNDMPTRIKKSKTEFQNLFSGRKDSLKKKLVDKLNNGIISESDAWEEYAKEVRGDAHSYREVIDSGLYHIGFLSPDGTLTELGYKYVDACERIDDAYTGIPIEILRASVLQNGQYGAMLHYFYKLSEDKFDQNLFAFATKNPKTDEYKFDSLNYLKWLDDEFTKLHLSKKSTLRAGGTRKPFQAELAFLKKMGFVKTIGTARKFTAYRVGLGLEIDWPQVQSSMMFFQNL